MCTIPTFKSGLPHVGRDDDGGGDGGDDGDDGDELCIVHNPCRVHRQSCFCRELEFLLSY